MNRKEIEDFTARFSRILLDTRSPYRAKEAWRAPDCRDPSALAPPDFRPVVSVIVPTRNRPEMLDEALQSILNQTYRNFEIIVVNDGDSDEAEGVAARLDTGGKIRYLKLSGKPRTLSGKKRRDQDRGRQVHSLP